MTKEKQIEEMAHHLCLWWDGKICTFTKHECNHDCSAFLDSARLYNAGYRKQSEAEWVGFWDYQCSMCHEYHDFKTKFCPNCGAKMKGV